MLKLSQFNLEFALPRSRPLSEDIEDQRRAIEHFTVKDSLEISALRRGQFVVENNGINLSLLATSSEFVSFACADESPRAWSRHLLKALADDLTPCASSQLRQFV